MEQQEQLEWDDLNKLLQHHGFKPVHFADPTENKNLSGLVLLDKASAGEMRATLRMMLTDSERRQTLIQELIKSNKQLKEEVQEHVSRAAQQSQRNTELEGLLDTVKTRVQDLEDRCLGKAIQQHSHRQQLQQEKQDTQQLCEILEQKLSKQREETAQLQRKLYFAVKEEERRLGRQNETFQLVCHRVIQRNSPQDQQVLDVIDFYETKMSELLDELRCVKGETEVSHPTKMSKASSSVTPSFKTILKAYRDEQKGSKGQIEELKREVERLKQELETRPTLKEVKFYKHKLRRLEAMTKQSSGRLAKEDSTTESGENVQDQTREANLRAHYYQLLTEIKAVVTGPKAPFQPYRQKPFGLATQQAEFQTLLPSLEVWTQQLHLLKDLQKGLNKLSARLMPWQPSASADNAADVAKVEDMMLTVDTMLENTSTDDEKVLRSPTRYTLGSMVSHFQRLFDVTSLRGVYPRMNEVYTRLAEANNAMRNLRDVLDLDSRVSPAEVVNHVARLVSSREDAAGFHNLLRDDDIESIIVKVKEHEEFFPAFHALIADILQTLGVSHLDDILPALKSLKQTTYGGSSD